MPSPLFINLLSRLDADPASAVVVSLAAVRSQGGTWSLSQGSVLLGPARMAALSWLEWRAENGERWAQEHQRRLTEAGMDLSRYSSFADVEGDWLLARFALDGPGSPAERAGRWMEQLTGPGVTVTELFQSGH